MTDKNILIEAIAQAYMQGQISEGSKHPSYYEARGYALTVIDSKEKQKPIDIDKFIAEYDEKANNQGESLFELMEDKLPTVISGKGNVSDLDIENCVDIAKEFTKKVVSLLCA